MDGFEAKHWSGDPFDETMVLLNDVVEIFRLDNADDPANARELEDNVDTLQANEISANLVDGDTHWDPVGSNGLRRHPPRAGHWLLSRLRICGNLRGVFHHPAVQGGMVDLNAAFRHDLFKITVRDAVTNVEKHLA